MTTTHSVPAELTAIVAGTLNVRPEAVTPQADFSDLGRTSAQEVELLVAIEDHYRITLDFGAFADLRTVGDLSDAIAAATTPRRDQ